MTNRNYRQIAQELANLKRRLNDKIEKPIESVLIFQEILQMHLKDDNNHFDEDNFVKNSKIQHSEI